MCCCVLLNFFSVCKVLSNKCVLCLSYKNPDGMVFLFHTSAWPNELGLGDECQQGNCIELERTASSHTEESVL